MVSVNHLEGHPHAFVDENDNVLNIAAFDGHDPEIISLVMAAQPNAVKAICLCIHGFESLIDKEEHANSQ